MHFFISVFTDGVHQMSFLQACFMIGSYLANLQAAIRPIGNVRASAHTHIQTQHRLAQ